MKRRNFLKASGGAILGLSGGQLTAAAAHFEAMPIRGLVRTNGAFFQPIQISFSGVMPRDAITKVDGHEYPHQPPSPEDQTIEVLVPAVDTDRQVSVTVESAGTTDSVFVKLKPVRKVLVYVLPHSHHDLGYTDLQATVEEKQIHNIDLGIDLARKTADYPEGARFVWNLEVLWGADLYLRRASAAKRAEFVNAVRAGGLALNGMYANELTGLCRPEELLQLFRYGTELGAQCGVKVDSAMLSDVPGCTWGTITAMGQAGIRYFSSAPNWFDRIGTLMAKWQDKPFWWVSPSGKEKILLWVPFTGYAMSHVVKKMSPGWVGDYQDRLDEVRFPYEISYIRWSGHGDNAEPDPEISEFIKSWGTKYAWPKFQIASTSTAFSAFEKRYGGALPEYRKDLTPYWEDGAGSSAFETALNRSAVDRLLQAEALFAMSEDQNVPREQVRETWRNVLLYSEHTWGAFNSVSDSENKFATDQWRVKRDFALNADRQSRELLTQALTNNGQSAGSGLDVLNTTSWTRSDLIVLSKELSAAGDRVAGKDGKAVASQRLITGELAIALQDVPPLAATRLTLQTDKAHFEGTPVTIAKGVLDNGLLRVRVDLQTGNIVELHSSAVAADNLADTSGGEALNEFLFLPGSNVADLQRSGPATVTIEEHGPLVASLRIESSAPACKRLTRRVKLVAGADYIEISNLVDKERAPFNPNPGKDGPGGAFAQNGNKESIQFAFPLKVPEGQIRVNAPFATMRPEVDQLPGSCKNWLPVGRWIDVSNEQFGVTLVSLDAPLAEIGEISANLLGSQRNPAAWRTHILPAQRFYSWVMNNHWGTNYRAYQEGVVEFRYALRPHKRYDPAAASRLAIGLSQPLLASPGGKSNSMPFLTVEPDDVLVTALKLSEDGKAFILRVFGASGQGRLAKLTWYGSKPKALWRSDLSEARLSTIQDEISVSGWELVTIRAEHS